MNLYRPLYILPFLAILLHVEGNHSSQNHNKRETRAREAVFAVDNDDVSGSETSNTIPNQGFKGYPYVPISGRSSELHHRNIDDATDQNVTSYGKGFIHSSSKSSNGMPKKINHSKPGNLASGDVEGRVARDGDGTDSLVSLVDERHLSADVEQVIPTVAATLGFNALVNALNEAKLVDALSKKGKEYTIFAPTENAFNALPEDVLSCLLRPRFSSVLHGILAHHIVEGKVVSNELSDKQTIPTLGNDNYTISIDNTGVFVDSAEVVETDILASNGVIHGINQVLVPSSINLDQLLKECSSKTQCYDGEPFEFKYYDKKNNIKDKGIVSCKSVQKKRKRRCKKMLIDGERVKDKCPNTCRVDVNKCNTKKAAMCNPSLFHATWNYLNGCSSTMLVNINCPDKVNCMYEEQRVEYLKPCGAFSGSSNCTIGGSFQKSLISYEESTGDCTLQYFDLSNDTCDLYTDEGGLGLLALINLDNPDEMLLWFSSTGGINFYNQAIPRIASRHDHANVPSRSLEIESDENQEVCDSEACCQGKGQNHCQTLNSKKPYCLATDNVEGLPFLGLCYECLYDSHCDTDKGEVCSIKGNEARCEQSSVNACNGAQSIEFGYNAFIGDPAFSLEYSQSTGVDPGVATVPFFKLGYTHPTTDNTVYLTDKCQMPVEYSFRVINSGMSALKTKTIGSTNQLREHMSTFLKTDASFKLKLPYLPKVKVPLTPELTGSYKSYNKTYTNAIESITRTTSFTRNNLIDFGIQVENLRLSSSARKSLKSLDGSSRLAWSQFFLKYGTHLVTRGIIGSFERKTTAISSSTRTSLSQFGTNLEATLSLGMVEIFDFSGTGKTNKTKEIFNVLKQGGVDQKTIWMGDPNNKNNAGPVIIDRSLTPICEYIPYPEFENLNKGDCYTNLSDLCRSYLVDYGVEDPQSCADIKDFEFDCIFDADCKGGDATKGGGQNCVNNRCKDRECRTDEHCKTDFVRKGDQRDHSELYYKAKCLTDVGLCVRDNNHEVNAYGTSDYVVDVVGNQGCTSFRGECEYHFGKANGKRIARSGNRRAAQFCMSEKGCKWNERRVVWRRCWSPSGEVQCNLNQQTSDQSKQNKKGTSTPLKGTCGENGKKGNGCCPNGQACVPKESKFVCSSSEVDIKHQKHFNPSYKSKENGYAIPSLGDCSKMTGYPLQEEGKDCAIDACNCDSDRARTCIYEAGFKANDPFCKPCCPTSNCVKKFGRPMTMDHYNALY